MSGEHRGLFVLRRKEKSANLHFADLTFFCFATVLKLVDVKIFSLNFSFRHKALSTIVERRNEAIEWTT